MGKSLKYFMRPEAKEEQIVTVPGPETIKDENGEVVQLEVKILSAEAIRKITSMPAALYGLTGKGMIRVGMDADLCLLDPETIIDAADYKNWNARCPGLKHVFVAGEAVVTDSVHDGRLLGKKLLRGW